MSATEADALAGASLTIARNFNAPPASVFSAWTNPEAIMKWWGLPGYTNLKASFEAEEGGTWAVTSRSPEGQEMTARGKVLKLIPNEMLVYDWRFDSMPDAAPSSIVTVRFSAKGAGTHILLEHANLPGADQVPLFRQGWEYTLANFAANVFGEQAA
jgi:uncharacterized protein YndB with AHSA1/START domain